MNDVVFSLDPSSTRTGWAVLNRLGQLIEAGLILPDKIHQLPEFRVNAMCHDLVTLLDKHMPQTILFEWPSGHVGHKHRGGGAGLTTYGCACGALWRECVGWRRQLPVDDEIQVKIILVPESWTNQVPKSDRQLAVSDMFKEYRIEQDPGADTADSLGMAVWYCRRQMLKLAEALR